MIQDFKNASLNSIPRVKINSDFILVPWWTKEIKNKIRERNRFLRYYKKSVKRNQNQNEINVNLQRFKKK